MYPASTGLFLQHRVTAKQVIFFLLMLSAMLFITGCGSKKTQNTGPKEIPLLSKWNGNYPVAELALLPAGQQDKPVGYISDTATFIPVWRAFMPTEILPAVDFSRNIVVFTRNTQFYNRMSILKITLQEGVAELISMETMSAIPIEDTVAMSMAVIPREGVTEIMAGTERITVIDKQ